MEEKSLFDTLLRYYGAQEFNYFFNLSLKNKFLYVEVSKAGCTTMKRALGGREMAGHLPDVHRALFEQDPHRGPVDAPFIRPFQLGPAWFDFFINRHDIAKFSVVRNPFSRILSAYIEKVLFAAPESENLRGELAQIKKVDPQQVAGPGVSFVEFLQAVASKPGAMSIDAHFRPQARHIALGVMKYDRIYKLEEIDAWLPGLLGLHNGDTNPVANRHHRLVGARSRLDHYYNQKTIDMVVELYDEDFAAFGYSRDLAQAA